MNLRPLPLLLASLLLAACGGNVIGGGSANSGGGGSGGDGSGGDGSGGGAQGGAPGSVPAVALTRAEMDVLWEEYWESQDPSGVTTSVGAGGSNLDPNDLFLRYSDVGVSCGSPTVTLPCGGHHEVRLVVPPALQQVGVYDLDDPLLVAYSSMSQTGAPNSNDPQDCSWGGGSTGPGTLEIIAIDATEVHFKVTLTSGIWDNDPGGEFVAPRCQGIL